MKELERLHEVEARLTAEITTLEERHRLLRNWLGTVRYIQNGTEESAAANGNGKRPMSAAARARISAAQKKRWAKTRASNPAGGGWTPKQDKAIVRAIELKHTPVSASEISRLIAGKVNRTQGAVRQRIARLARKGILKETASGNGKLAHLVEVAK